jgi:hypothetical protein
MTVPPGIKALIAEIDKTPLNSIILSPEAYKALPELKPRESASFFNKIITGWILFRYSFEDWVLAMSDEGDETDLWSFYKYLGTGL